MSINAETINKIIEISRPEKIEIDGKDFITPEYKVVEPPHQDGLTVYTLTGFLDYIKTNPDKLHLQEHFVFIESYNKVRLLNPIDCEWGKRDSYLSAINTSSAFLYESWRDPETTIIGINSGFERKGDFEYVLKIISNITQEARSELNDNGISQTTAVKSGFGGMLEKITIKNPVQLYPFRTFRDIDQPLVESLFRINKSGEVAFFEVGDAWKLEAIKNIKNWLIENECPLKIIA